MTNVHKIFLILFAFFISVAGFSQMTRITGTASGAEGKSIQLTSPADLITFVEQTLASSVIDSTGQFTLSTALQTPVFASLNIDFHRVDLYLEPGKSYLVKFAPMNYNLQTDANPLIQSQSIQIEFINPDTTDLNYLVSQFSVIYNNFLLGHFNALYRDRQKAKLDSFKLEIRTAFPDVRNAYFQSYIRYKIASLEQLAQALPMARIAKQYYTDSPVLYENTEYMDLFNQFFSKYLSYLKGSQAD
jgi:hypothetical protein